MSFVYYFLIVNALFVSGFILGAIFGAVVRHYAGRAVGEVKKAVSEVAQGVMKAERSVKKAVEDIEDGLPHC